MIEFVVSFTDMRQFRAHGFTRDPLNERPILRAAKTQNVPKNKFGQQEVSTSKRKLTTKRAIDVGNRKDIVDPVPLNANELQPAYIPEKLCPPPPSDATYSC